MDLVPADYRRFVLQLRMLKRWSRLVLVYVVVAGVATIGLKYSSDDYQAQIIVLEKRKAISTHQRGILEELKQDHAQLAAKREILEKLRGGALAEDMFVNIDRALDGEDVWFKNWKFSRAGTRTNEPPKGVNTGYFIVIPEGARTGQNEQEAWKIQTHMEVSGQATDHQALSSFVRRVLQQPQIGDVRILNTQQQAIAGQTVVDFRLVITVNSGFANS